MLQSGRLRKREILTKKKKKISLLNYQPKAFVKKSRVSPKITRDSGNWYQPSCSPANTEQTRGLLLSLVAGTSSASAKAQLLLKVK